MKKDFALTKKYHLTDRLVEYLSLTAMGFSNDKIAEILCVEKTTVKKSLEEMFLKFHAVDRTSMVDIAREYGILTNEIKYHIALKYNIHLPFKDEERYISAK